MLQLSPAGSRLGTRPNVRCVS